MARMPKASRTEAALSPKGRGADSGGESEAAKGGCEETNVLPRAQVRKTNRDVIQSNVEIKSGNGDLTKDNSLKKSFNPVEK